MKISFTLSQPSKWDCKLSNHGFVQNEAATQVQVLGTMLWTQKQENMIWIAFLLWFSISEGIVGPDCLIILFFSMLLATRGLFIPSSGSGFSISSPQFQVNGNAAFENINGVNHLAVPQDAAGPRSGAAWHPPNTTVKAPYSLSELRNGWEVRFSFDTSTSIHSTQPGRGTTLLLFP